MASKWSQRNQNFSYGGKFQWLFDQGKGNLVQFSEEFHSHPSSSYQGSTVIIAEKTTENNVSR